MNPGEGRLDWIDGLRGLAVLLVLVDHATVRWQDYSVPLLIASNMGSDGVSLFLVISGLCLSLPLLRKRQSGDPTWLNVPRFFQRRAWRILPPYYAAIAACALLAWGMPPWYRGYGVVQPGVADVVEHLALVHNLDPVHIGGLNPAFWSLGLEAQWYLVFPLLLLAMVARPRTTLAVVFVGGVLGTLAILGATGLQSAGWVLLPGRLFEFVLGIGIALLLVSGQRVRPLPAVLVAVPIWCVLHFAAKGSLIPTLIAGGLFYPLLGVSMAALVLAGARWSGGQRLLSRKWPVRIGQASYSIYLMHYPAVDVTGRVLHDGLAVPVLPGSVLVLMAGLGFGLVFHHAVEKPALHLASERRKRSHPSNMVPEPASS